MQRDINDLADWIDYEIVECGHRVNWMAERFGVCATTLNRWRYREVNWMTSNYDILYAGMKRVAPDIGREDAWRLCTGEELTAPTCVSDLIRQIAFFKGKSYKTMARETGVLYCVIQAWIFGKENPSRGIVNNLAYTLEVDDSEILKLIPPRKKRKTR